MPWKETCVQDQRLSFVAMFLEDQLSMTDLCREFNISRKTGYELVHAYRMFGLQALMDRSSAPLSHPNATPEALEQRIIFLRTSHPSWGPKKLRASLKQCNPSTAWPAPSTIGDILKRNGLVTKR